MEYFEEIPWSSSGDEQSDSEFCFEESIDEDLLSEAGSTSKLQPRKTVIKACWNEELGMSEVLQHKGGLLISIGIVRNTKIYLSIEETLYLAEIGSLMLVDDKDTTVLLKEIYEKVANGKGGCTWEYFEVYRYLKSLGYIVGRHDIPWSLKSVRNCSNPVEGTVVEKTIVRAVLDETSIAGLLKGLQISEKKLFFDVYLPNSKFRKTSPGDPVFTVSLARHYPPSISEIGVLERQCNGIPLKIVHVDHGRVSFFSFEQVELPTLP
ncbi:hypothetical protein RND81_02G048100 [Saponaria officinalis]|uniref:tRNA-splicing endonuclease subunit Sen54 N-terminal domain-containing protein n=1 Tax=Saponaria officinalis TaxID=3572 RepID=A0AAW1MQ46_SAPOF